MKSILIVNATLVNEGKQLQSDVRIKNGRIEKVSPSISSHENDVLIDAQGKFLIPGMIDDQVHFREPGLTQKGEIKTESAAAIAGGITSYMEMPNVNPATVDHQALHDKYDIAADKSMANFAFYLGATNHNIEAIKSLNPNDACGVKVFMGASTGNLLVDDPEALENIFSQCPVLIATHCEDTPTILANQRIFEEKYGKDVSIEHHPLIRSEEACYLSSSYAVSLAKKHNTHLHVLHLTTAKELELFSAGDINGKHITAEACVHHLFFNENDYAKLGNQIKCNPAIKTRADQQGILNAVKNDIIDIIATDHAPHTLEEKQRSYLEAPAGLPLVQHALLSLLEHYHNNVFDLELIVRKTSHAPAQRYQVKDRGFIREGYWADLVLLDTNNGYTPKKNNTLYKCGWSPFEDYPFRSSIDTTIINGQIAYTNGEIQNSELRGMRLEFDRKS